MKTILLVALVVTVAFLSSCRKADTAYCGFVDFKYYNDEPYHLGELSNDYIELGIDDTYGYHQTRNFIATLNEVDQSYDYTIYDGQPDENSKRVLLKLRASKNCEAITAFLDELKEYEMVSYANYCFQAEDCLSPIWQPMGDVCVHSYGSDFFVKVADANDLTDLNRIIAETNTELVAPLQFMPEWLKLRTTKASKGNALQMANYFYETGLFEASEISLAKTPVE